MNIIETRNLTRRFGRTVAVDRMNLEVPEGALLALIGPNGAGKSTAFRTMLNVLGPTGGRATVLGVDSRKIGPTALQQIGYVADDQKLPEWMTLSYFFGYCRNFYPAWDDRELDGFDLPLDRQLGKLSRGMRMKALLASSLAYHPRLLMLDEPFSGLDPLVRDELIESLVARMSGVTVIVASHDLAEIEMIATHIGYLDSGRLIFVEEASALSNRFRSVEVVLDAPLPPNQMWPREWLNVEQSPTLLRFVDSQFVDGRTQQEILARVQAVRDIAIRTIPLRETFVALAKSRQV